MLQILIILFLSIVIYEKSIRDKPKVHNLIGYRSLEKIAESIEDDFQVKPVRSTILN
ncbi:hypothetical protein AGMMS49960_22280 [Betaproteobacteria bacterium]|nr:hypothetical protein AGMMS49960_22280 [Betaproteobacteria bacterium]